ncbi:protein cornichon homolog 4-like [Solanum stenotomum]|uniref:protein cornichon homolog 4-like n=1 Tax=Solanum stenotomum TaxID=172797 RepID=UPI0020D13BEA|nr:protein cornichon homolog 4-like [Solanum stenotomum]
MGDLLSWLLSFFLLVAVLAIVLYQVMCLADLENDYVNPYDSASEINILVIPEFVLQGALCFLHLVMGHWLMCLVCLPYLYYDVKVYTDRCHLLDVTEIFNQLPREKKIRLFKLGYLGIHLAISIICMIWSIVAE